MRLNPDTALRRVTLEIEEHAGLAGWDQPARLFALVLTEALLASNPELAGQLSAGELTPVEQDGLPTDRQLEEALPAIVWPPAVAGCAAVVERVMLPSGAEAGLPQGDDEALIAAVAQHPDRQEVRLTVSVLRDGEAHCLVRGRAAGGADLLEGDADLVPGLVELLRSTFE